MESGDLKTNEQSVNSILFKIAMLTTFIAMTTSVVRFFTREAYPPNGIEIFYIGVLAIYSLHKEILNWIMEREGGEHKRRGEIFVYLWLILAAALYIVNFFSKGYYKHSVTGQESHALAEISFIALEVGGIFVLSRAIKAWRMYVLNRK